jgi:hypothetical protein
MERLSESDREFVGAIIRSAMDQILEQFQGFAGGVLGEIFSLVMELWRTETGSGESSVAQRR